MPERSEQDQPQQRSPVLVDTRNDFSARRRLPFQSYVSVVVVAGVVVVVAVCARLEPSAVLAMEPAFWAVCALLLVAELRPLFTAGARDPNGSVLTTAFVFALMLRYGLEVAVLVQAVATTAIDLSRSRAPWRIGFNVGQYALSWTAAATAMGLLGFAPDATPRDLAAAELPVAAVGALAYFVVNQVLVGLALALKLARPLWHVLREDLAYESVSNGALLALSPLVVLIVEEGVAFVPLLVPPLLVVYKVGAIALERERQAMTDALTGLPNRKRLADRTAEAFEDGGAVGPALLLFDLDRFKEVNDTLGHHVGDQLLQVVGSRLTAAVRPGDMVARLGGDEFAVLLPATGAEEADETAGRLLEQMSAPIRLGGLLLDVRGSVGVAAAPEHGVDLDELLQHADVAMYLAKEGGGGVEQYDARRDRNSPERLTMVGELREALALAQLEVHYQPQASSTAAGSPGWRRWCGGGTRSAVWCPRTSSCRLPRAAG